MATQLPLLPRSHNFHVEARQWARHHLKPWDVETGGLSSLLNCMNLHQVVSEPVSPPQAAVTVSLVLAVRVTFSWLCIHVCSQNVLCCWQESRPRHVYRYWRSEGDAADVGKVCCYGYTLIPFELVILIATAFLFYLSVFFFFSFFIIFALCVEWFFTR